MKKLRECNEENRTLAARKIKEVVKRDWNYKGPRDEQQRYPANLTSSSYSNEADWMSPKAPVTNPSSTESFPNLNHRHQFKQSPPPNQYGQGYLTSNKIENPHDWGLPESSFSNTAYTRNPSNSLSYASPQSTASQAASGYQKRNSQFSSTDNERMYNPPYTQAPTISPDPFSYNAGSNGSFNLPYPSAQDERQTSSSISISNNREFKGYFNTAQFEERVANPRSYNTETRGTSSSPYAPARAKKPLPDISSSPAIYGSFNTSSTLTSVRENERVRPNVRNYNAPYHSQMNNTDLKNQRSSKPPFSDEELLVRMGPDAVIRGGIFGKRDYRGDFVPFSDETMARIRNGDLWWAKGM